MRIAFVGKGGSGKTTLSSLFCRYLADQGKPVLAIDADINQHLADALGMDAATAAAIPPLGADMTLLKEWLRGTNPLIRSAEDMIKTTPPGNGSRLLRFSERNPIFSAFAREADGVRLMATGGFDEDDIGVSCFHSKTGAVELLLNHLVDAKEEYAVVDMTAGADAFASGLFTRFDLTVLVVEPTMKSLTVYEQYASYAKSHGVRLAVVGNKVSSERDEAFLREKVGDALIALIPHSDFIRARERGERPAGETLEPEVFSALASIIRALDAVPKDWERFWRQAAEFHVKNAVSWASASAGRDLTEQIDPQFDPHVAFGS